MIVGIYLTQSSLQFDFNIDEIVSFNFFVDIDAV